MNRTTRKPGEHYTIWMTRKMPHSVLNRLHVLAARHRQPLWKVHQVALHIGVACLNRKGVKL